MQEISQQVGDIQYYLIGHDLSRSDQHRMNQFERRRVCSEEPNQGLSHLDVQIREKVWSQPDELAGDRQSPCDHWIPVRDRFDEAEGGQLP